VFDNIRHFHPSLIFGGKHLDLGGSGKQRQTLSFYDEVEIAAVNCVIAQPPGACTKLFTAVIFAIS
jgi:hypothetical protein